MDGRGNSHRNNCRTNANVYEKPITVTKGLNLFAQENMKQIIKIS